jgi:hypothetical protein
MFQARANSRLRRSWQGGVSAACVPSVGLEDDRLRREVVFVQQAAEPVATAHVIELQQFVARRRFVYRRWFRERRPLVERAVRPVSVVVPRVDVNHAFEVGAAKDQQPVETFAARAFNPALGVRTRSRRPPRRLDHADPLGAEDLVEAGGELAVPVADQKACWHMLVVQAHDQVGACWVTQAPPGLVVMPLLAACRRKNSLQLGVEPVWRGLDARLAQDRPDGAGREPDAKSHQLTLDPPVPPARILPRQPQHQLTHSDRRPRTAGATMCIRPATSHKLPMPAQNRRREGFQN